MYRFFRAGDANCVIETLCYQIVDMNAHAYANAAILITGVQYIASTSCFECCWLEGLQPPAGVVMQLWQSALIAV